MAPLKWSMKSTVELCAATNSANTPSRPTSKAAAPSPYASSPGLPAFTRRFSLATTKAES